MLSPSTSATLSSPTKSRPMRNAWSRPSGRGCRTYSIEMPTRRPSPKSRSNEPMSSGVEISSTARTPAGISVDALRGDLGKRLRQADLIVAKGMANYEALSETDIGPVAYLLRTKCHPVADSIGLDKDINAVKLLPHGGVR